MKLLLAIATSIFITRSVIAQTDQSFGVPANDLYCKNIKQKDSDSFSCVFLDLIDQQGVILPSWLQSNELEFLSMVRTGLDSIPNIIWTMTKLCELLLGGNNIHTIPAEVCKLKDLCSLSLYGNPITGLPDCLAENECLEMLVLGGTNLEHLPEVLFKIPNLRFVDFGTKCKIPKEELILFHELRPEVEMAFW